MNRSCLELFGVLALIFLMVAAVFVGFLVELGVL